MLFLSVTASAISWQYSLKISFNYLFFSSLRNIFNISYASVISNSSVAMSQDYLFPRTCLIWSTTFCGQPRQLRGICADSTATKLYRSQAFNVDEMRITDKLFQFTYRSTHLACEDQIPSLSLCLMCDAMSVKIPYWLWSASLALHHSLCLDLVEDRLHVVSSEVLQKQNTPTSCAAEAEAQNPELCKLSSRLHANSRLCWAVMILFDWVTLIA